VKINLELVRETLRDALGFNSFVAGFITEVSEDPKITTAGINNKGQLHYNPAFVEKNVVTRKDLFCLIFHELLHPMFGHFIYDSGDLENIAADAIINAVISQVYAEKSGNGAFFKKLYKDRGVECLLRPGISYWNVGNFASVYQHLYNDNNGRSAMSTGELIQILKTICQAQNVSSICLLGSHGKGASGAGASMSNELLAKIAEDIKEGIRGGKFAGYGDNLFDMFMEVLKTHLSIKRLLLQKFLTKRKLDHFINYYSIRRSGISPIPLSPSKRDMVLLSCGFYPMYFHNQVFRPKSDTHGIVVYLDVSGSVDQYLPKILSVLSNLKGDIKSIFQFSNQVKEISMELLAKGNVRTTHGTDFDCVAESILKNNYDKAIIITDGYGGMTDANTEALLAAHVMTMAILFELDQKSNEFAKFGDVVYLDDVCE
jgi:hypothetical protein